MVTYHLDLGLRAWSAGSLKEQRQNCKLLLFSITRCCCIPWSLVSI